MLGYERLEPDTEVPQGYKTSKSDDPYPISIFGESKTIADNKIINYLNDYFYYYLDIYNNCKQFGLPYNNWLDCPKWILKLINLFDDTSKKFERYKLSNV